jgi:hypothetical protein
MFVGLPTNHPESRLAPSVLVATKVLSWTVKRAKNLLSDFGVTFGLFLDTYYDKHSFKTQAGIYPSRSGTVGQTKELLWRQSLLHQESTL